MIMSASQRRKGAVGEREGAAVCEIFGLNVSRQARNGVDGGADLAGDGIVIEVKRRTAMVLEGWMKQAEESRVRPIDIAVVLARQDSSDWILSIRMKDFDEFIRLTNTHRLAIMEHD